MFAIVEFETGGSPEVEVIPVSWLQCKLPVSRAEKVICSWPGKISHEKLKQLLQTTGKPEKLTWIEFDCRVISCYGKGSFYSSA